VITRRPALQILHPVKETTSAREPDKVRNVVRENQAPDRDLDRAIKGILLMPIRTEYVTTVKRW